MTINGRPATTGSTFEVRDPATMQVAGLSPECSRAQLDDAMHAAQTAFEPWAAHPDTRTACMRSMADALDAAAGEIGRITTIEQGMPLASGMSQVHRSAATFRRYAALKDLPEVVQDDDVARIEVHRRPIGVVAAIKPWNVPIVMASNTLAPALRAGCTVVLKPSPYTPLATLRMGEILRDILPPGVVNVISGGDELGRWMVEHPVPGVISFTGSTETGLRVNAAAVAGLKRVLLELGGNDAAIVLDDADPSEIAEGLFWGAFRNTGQICMAIKRLLVPEAMAEAMAEALATVARSARVGPGLLPGVTLGPINNEEQFGRVTELLAAALDDGGRVIAGGNEVAGDGLFFEPTIVTGVGDESRLVAEEQFGPVLPLLSYRTIDEAVARANDTSFGLGNSVWSADPERAARVAARLMSGMVWVNTHGVLAHNHPFGGRKLSGLGVEGGIWGVHAYTDAQTIYVARAGHAGPGGR